MNKEKISDAQGIKLLILFLFGSTLIMGTGGNAGRDTWLSILVGMIFIVPVYLIYCRILFLFPGKDLIEILELVFGRLIGKLLSLIFIWYAFHLGALVMRDFGEFVVTMALPETPMVVSLIAFGLLCIWGAKAGIETLAKCGEYFSVFVFVLLIIYSLLSMPSMDIQNALPIMGQGLGKSLGGVLGAMTYPFGEAVIFLFVFSALPNKGSCYKNYFWALFVSGITIAYIALRNTMILGSDTLAAVYFPAYIAISRINIGNFLQRIEVGVSIVFMLSGFIKTAICMLASAKGLGRVFNFDDYRILVTPLGLLMTTLSYTVFKSVIEMNDWTFQIWPYYSIPFQFILPLLIWVFIEIKQKSKNGSMGNEKAADDSESA